MGCSAFIYIAGFLVAIPVFLFLFLKCRSKEGWVVSIITPCVVVGVVYVAFVWLLRIPLYQGIFFEY